MERECIKTDCVKDGSVEMISVAGNVIHLVANEKGAKSSQQRPVQQNQQPNDTETMSQSCHTAAANQRQPHSRNCLGRSPDDFLS